MHGDQPGGTRHCTAAVFLILGGVSRGLLHRDAQGSEDCRMCLSIVFEGRYLRVWGFLMSPRGSPQGGNAKGALCRKGTSAPTRQVRFCRPGSHAEEPIHITINLDIIMITIIIFIIIDDYAYRYYYK